MSTKHSKSPDLNKAENAEGPVELALTVGDGAPTKLEISQRYVGDFFVQIYFFAGGGVENNIVFHPASGKFALGRFDYSADEGRGLAYFRKTEWTGGFFEFTSIVERVSGEVDLKFEIDGVVSRINGTFDLKAYKKPA